MQVNNCMILRTFFQPMSPDASILDPAADASREAIVRAAWLYYTEGMTQDRIARDLGVTRARVIAWLAQAREQGLVAVRIAGKGDVQARLEQALRARYGLAHAVVVPAAAHPAHATTLVGHAAGSWLSERMRDGVSVGIGWGATLHASLRAIRGRPLRGASIVSLLGATTRSRTVTPPAVARRMADAFGAECYQLTAPLVVADPALRRLLWREPGLRDLRERARRVDIALLSVGTLRDDSTLYRDGVLPRAARASLARAGAVGDVLCRFVDAAGRAVDHPLNAQTMSIDAADLARVAQVAIASGGLAKVPILRAALRALSASVLITDEAAAAGLLDD
jgi:DNA-binding transcriptional regulator LsrR (DeoR family)